MSQEKLAEKAELHPVHVGKLERGGQWISLHTLLSFVPSMTHGEDEEECCGGGTPTMSRSRQCAGPWGPLALCPHNRSL
jgi:hypothetical protein